jgi:hypothetical protein
LHPKLGVALEILPGIWRHSEPAFPYALSRRWALRLTGRRSTSLTRRWPVRCCHWRRPMRWRHWGGPANRTTMLLRLRLRGSATENETDQADG